MYLICIVFESHANTYLIDASPSYTIAPNQYLINIGFYLFFVLSNCLLNSINQNKKIHT